MVLATYRGAMSSPIGGIALRRAGGSDAEQLTVVEREAGLAALGHVFPPDRYPYPTAEVRARWQRVLSEPHAACLVAQREGEIVGFLAWQGDTVEHLAVHPSTMRRGVATVLLGQALDEIWADHPEARLWVLRDNQVARAFYRGWTPTGLTRRAEFPPFPHELQLAMARPQVSAPASR